MPNIYNLPDYVFYLDSTFYLNMSNSAKERIDELFKKQKKSD